MNRPWIRWMLKPLRPWPATALGLLLAAAPLPAQCRFQLPVLMLASASARLPARLPPDFIRVQQPRKAAVKGLQSSPPHRVLLLLDDSGSIGASSRAGGTIWSNAVADGEALLRGLPPALPVRVAIFDSDLRWVSPYQPAAVTVPAAPFEKVRAHVPYGRTVLNDAVIIALRSTPGLQAGDVIVALSDGEDNLSNASDHATLQALLQTGVRLIIVNHAPSVAADDLALLRLEYATNRNLPLDSGGLYLIAGDGHAAAAELGALLAHQLAMTIAVPPGEHGTLALGLSSAGRGVSLFYPRRPLSCAR